MASKLYKDNESCKEENNVKEKANTQIPMISLIMNGGIDALLVVKQNLINKIPTLLLAVNFFHFIYIFIR